MPKPDCGGRHNTEFWTQLCISVAKVLFRPGLEPATVEDGVLFLFYAMDFMPPERLKKTFQEGNIALLVSKLRREETNDGNFCVILHSRQKVKLIRMTFKKCVDTG